MYLLEQGPTEQQILQQAYRSRMDLPESIKNAPQLWLGLGLYLQAWLDLNTCRSAGMSEGPIPWLAVHTYCTEFDLSDDQREAMHHHIRVMDQIYFKDRERKRKAANA